MQVSAIPEPEQYWAALKPHLPSFSVEEQRAAVALYRKLATGKPVDDAQLARTLWPSAIETRALLERDAIKCLIYPHDHGRVLGFGGLAAAVMHHRFEVDGRGTHVHHLVHRGGFPPSPICAIIFCMISKGLPPCPI